MKHRMAFTGLFAAALIAGWAPTAFGQGTATLSLVPVPDVAVGDTLTLDVQARRFQSARTAEIIVIADAAYVRWNDVLVGEGAEGMVVLDRRQRGDTLAVALSHVNRQAGTTLLRTETVLRLRGVRLRPGVIDFRLGAAPVGVVTRSLAVQPVTTGDPVTTDVERADAPTVTRLLRPYPSPARDQVTLRFEAAHEAAVEAQVYDLTGRLVARATAPHVSPGSQGLSLPLTDLPSGLYVYRLTLAGPHGTTLLTGTFTALR